MEIYNIKLTPQQFTLIELHEDGKWVCSTAVEYMRDARKRYSELSRMGFVFKKEKCKQYGHSHNSGLLMRRLVEWPKSPVSPKTALPSVSGTTGRVFTIPLPGAKISANSPIVESNQGIFAL